MKYALVPLIDARWMRSQGDNILGAATGLKNRVRHYLIHCLGIPWSKIIFNREYFAEKMREARKRQKEDQERRRYLVPKRDSFPSMTSEIKEEDFRFIDDLFQEEFKGLGMSKELALAFVSRPEYAYEKHKKAILERIGYENTAFDDLPQVVPDRKLNRIFNFVTIIFLQHYQLIDITQTADCVIRIRKMA